MGPASCDEEKRVLWWVSRLVLAVAIFGDAWFLLAALMVAPLLPLMLLPGITGLSLGLFHWLQERRSRRSLALLWTAVALLLWPVTTILLMLLLFPIGSPNADLLPFLIGPLIPFAGIAWVGVMITHSPPPTIRR